MPRHTPMDSDPSPLYNDSSEDILRPEVTKRPINLRPASIMRWLLVATSLGVLLFV